MNQPIMVHLAVEDVLSKAVADKILKYSVQSFEIGFVYPMRGKSYLEKKVHAFCRISRHIPHLVIVDLDRDGCAPDLMVKWLRKAPRHGLIFRVAVTEIEAWLMADRLEFAKFIGVPVNALPFDTDFQRDAKEFVVELASKSSKKAVREDIVPSRFSGAKVGANYNKRLIRFVKQVWSPARAGKHSDSLRRAMRSLDEYELRAS